MSYLYGERHEQEANRPEWPKRYCPCSPRPERFFPEKAAKDRRGGGWYSSHRPDCPHKILIAALACVGPLVTTNSFWLGSSGFITIANAFAFPLLLLGPGFAYITAEEPTTEDGIGAMRQSGWGEPGERFPSSTRSLHRRLLRKEMDTWDCWPMFVGHCFVIVTLLFSVMGL